MILKLQSAERMGDAFKSIREAMRIIVHRVEAPLVSCSLMSHLADAINHWISQVDVWGSHIDLGTKHMSSVFKFP